MNTINILLGFVARLQDKRPKQTDTTLLAKNSLQCWALLRPFARGLKVTIHETIRNDDF